MLQKKTHDIIIVDFIFTEEVNLCLILVDLLIKEKN